ncbi:hypothetical protein C1645_745672 [Glomus cerebriforme]|uniref:Uncharacterized protein n=1 Tax=Glomus cerebriforme TaxID=658196 RepID=A0A397S1I5_9GLOM|nr:hypothetical protein C1645_745672 [Glomus cerebriforme]
MTDNFTTLIHMGWEKCSSRYSLPIGGGLKSLRHLLSEEHTDNGFFLLTDNFFETDTWASIWSQKFLRIRSFYMEESGFFYLWVAVEALSVGLEVMGWSLFLVGGGTGNFDRPGAFGVTVNDLMAQGGDQSKGVT